MQVHPPGRMGTISKVRKMWLFLIFVAVPIIEIALFIQVGGAIGLFPTLAIVIATALAGTLLMRQQGFSTLARLQSSMGGEGDPLSPILHGVLILAAGLLLLTPGFFTDAVGFALLVPSIRQAFIARMAERIRDGRMRVYTAAGPAHAPQAPDGGPDGDIVDAEYEEVEPGPKTPGSSGWTRGPDT